VGLKFGTSGLRGLVTEMTDAVCEAHVRAFLVHLRETGAAPREVLVGRDLRPSSARIAAACRRAVRDEGAVAVGCGVAPTPALALEAGRRGAAAVMVTGSHIPFDRNGLKFYLPGGEEISKGDEAGILAALSAPGAARGAGAVRVDTGAGARYVARSVDFFGAGCLGGLRVGLYEHSAAGREHMRKALAALGAEVVPLGRSASFVPIDTEAIQPEQAERIRAWVEEHRLAALVSTDGDGDRPLVADEAGRVLRGDALGALAARLLGADAVAAPLNASTALERSGWFARVLRTKIGSPHVIAGMARLKAEGARLVVGYEANGGFLLGGTAVSPAGRRLEALPTRDAMAPALAVLAAMAREGRTLSDLAGDLPERATDSGRLQEVDVAAAAGLLDGLAASEAAAGPLLAGLGTGGLVATDTLDGVRMQLASGEIVHLRLSGNAPELRCYAEAATAGRAAELAAAVLGRVEGMLG
jgi:phosphomannomutase